jgi:hypothetical protein
MDNICMWGTSTQLTLHTLRFSGTHAEHVLAFNLMSEWIVISFWVIYAHSTAWSHVAVHHYPVSLPYSLLTEFLKSSPPPCAHAHTHTLSLSLSSMYNKYSAQPYYGSSLSPSQAYNSSAWVPITKVNIYSLSYVIITILKMHASCEHVWNSSSVTIPSPWRSRSEKPILI